MHNNGCLDMKIIFINVEAANHGLDKIDNITIIGKKSLPGSATKVSAQD